MFKKKYTIIALISSALIANIPMAEAARAKTKNLAYTQKQNAKVASLLKSARKQVDKGKMQNAINSYWKVLELDPSEAYAYLELGELYKNLRIYDRSIEMLSSGLDLAQDIDNNTICYYYCQLVELYSITDQQGLANKALIKAAEAAPRNPMPRKVLGDIYLKNNRVVNAYKAYKKSIELDPDYQPAIDALKDLKLEYGNKLPKEDKDSEYIKKVAVKLENKSNNTDASDKSQSTKAVSQTAQTTFEKETTSIVKPQKLDSKSERPMPLSSEEMNTIAAKNKKKTIAISDSISETEKIPTDELEIEYTNEESTETLEEIINKNIDKFLEGNYNEKKEALAFFVECGRTGLSAIEELLYDRNPEVRILAVKALPNFVDYKDEVRAILNDATDDSDEEVIQAINEALNSL